VLVINRDQSLETILGTKNGTFLVGSGPNGGLQGQMRIKAIWPHGVLIEPSPSRCVLSQLSLGAVFSAPRSADARPAPLIRLVHPWTR